MSGDIRVAGANIRFAVAAVVPNHDGAGWLGRCLGALHGQQRAFDEVLVVDDASRDDSLAVLERDWPAVRVVALERNRGFAAAVNAGIAATRCDAVALVNTDVELAPDWLARTAAALEADPGAAAVACKMVSLRDSGVLDDCGDVLRRDGVCEQRGHGRRDDGRWDAPGEVFSACAGAALYRRTALEAAGGFDERLFAYLEDVDLGLRGVSPRACSPPWGTPPSGCGGGGPAGAAATSPPRRATGAAARPERSSRPSPPGSSGTRCCSVRAPFPGGGGRDPSSIASCP